jgi:hypothetical protein
MAQALPIENDTVAVVDGSVVIHNLIERDPEVVRVVAEAADPVEATQQVLRIGARAVRVAHVSVDGDVIEKHFDAMTDRLGLQVEDAVVQIAGVAETLLAEEDGALPAVLSAHTQQLESILGATFDPDSKKSVLALFEQVMITAHEQHTTAIKRLISADGDDSPLAQLGRTVVAEIEKQLRKLERDVKDVSEKIAVQEAVAPVLDLTTAKGFRFEDVVDARVNEIAAHHGDVAERTGTTSGLAGNQKGDEVVAVNRDDVNGADACFVLEVKARKLTMRQTAEELDDAIENRGALAGIAVFSTQQQAPTSVPFQYSDNKAIVVLDKEGLDDSALRLAYMWARWVVRRQLAGAAADKIDAARISRLIDDARRAVERHSNIKRSHSTAKKAIDAAGEQASAMAAEVNDALAEIADELAGDDR